MTDFDKQIEQTYVEALALQVKGEKFTEKVYQIVDLLTQANGLSAYEQVF